MLHNTTFHYCVLLCNTQWYLVLDSANLYSTVPLCINVEYPFEIWSSWKGQSLPTQSLQDIALYIKLLVFGVLCKVTCQISRNTTKRYTILASYFVQHNTSLFYTIPLGTTQYYFALQNTDCTTLYYFVLHHSASYKCKHLSCQIKTSIRKTLQDKVIYYNDVLSVGFLCRSCISGLTLYSVLHNATFVLHSTAVYYTIPTQYYFALHSITLQWTRPLCSTQYYFVLLMTTSNYTVLLCTTQYNFVQVCTTLSQTQTFWKQGGS